MNYQELKKKAIKLRKEGKTYSEILKKVPVAKSTVSLWLREIGLSVPQKQRITEKRIRGRLKALHTIKKNKIERVRRIKEEAMKEVANLIKDPLWLTGLILYWGEGTKERHHSSDTEISNMDINIHKIFINWSKKFLNTNDDDFRYEVYIHEKADIGGAIKYWCSNLNLKFSQLRIYYKKHNPKTKRKNIGANYYGVMKTGIARSSSMNRRIAGWIEGVVVYLSSQDLLN